MAAFYDVEKTFDNVWHNGLRYKIFMLDLPTKIYTLALRFSSWSMSEIASSKLLKHKNFVKL